MGAIGVGTNKIALEAGDDVIGEGFGVQNRKTGSGDEEEAAMIFRKRCCGCGAGVGDHG